MNWQILAYNISKIPNPISRTTIAKRQRRQTKACYYTRCVCRYFKLLFNKTKPDWCWAVGFNSGKVNMSYILVYVYIHMNICMNMSAHTSEYTKQSKYYNLVAFQCYKRVAVFALVRYLMHITSTQVVQNTEINITHDRE